MILGAVACRRDPIDQDRSTAAWIAALNDTSASVREVAAYKLSESDPPPMVLRAMARALAEDDDNVRSALAGELIRLGRRNGRVVGAVTEILRARPHRVARVEAARVLGGVGQAARGAVPILLCALDAPDAELRAAAVAALGDIGWTDDRIVAPVERATADTSADVRANAIEALVKLTSGETLLAVARRGLSDDAPAVREQAVYAAMTLGPRAAPVVAPLAAALSDTDPEVRAGAASALASIGAAARDAVPALKRALTDSNPHVSATAAKALDVMRESGPRN